MYVDLLIGLRIVYLIVDAVQNATERTGTCAEQTVQLFAVIRCLDLFGIGLADGGDIVCIDQTAFQHIGIALEFQLIRREHIIRQVGVIDKVTDVPHALEFQIVDGHDALGSPIKAMGRKGAFEEYGDHAGLPVVAVNDVRMESDHRHCRQDSL